MKKAKCENGDTINSVVDYYLTRRNYSSLVNFVNTFNDEYSKESRKLLFSVFIHYCIELIESGFTAAARKVFVKFNQLFTEKVSHKPLIDTLALCISNQCLDQRLKSVKKAKCSISVDEKYVQHFLHFLENLNNFTLHRIISNCIDFIIIESSITAMDSDTSCLIPQLSPRDVKPSVSNFCMKQKLEDIIRKLKEDSPTVSCVCLCSVENANPTCVSVNPDLRYLATGFESSDIHLWSLTAEPVFKNDFHIDNSSSLRLSIPKQSKNLPEENMSVLNSQKCLLRGHSDTVYQMCFVPDSELLLSCSEDTTVRSWNINLGTNSRIYYGHDYPIWCIDASRFGFYFVTGSKDTTARLWSVERSYPLRIYAGHTMDVDCVKFHPNCNYIATGSHDKTIRLWSVNEAKMVRIFRGHNGNVHALAFTPDGKQIISAGEDCKIRLWDISSGALINEFRAHTDTIYSIDINQDQSILTSCGLDRALKLWDFDRILKMESEFKEKSESKIDISFDNSVTFQPLIAYHTQYSLLLSQFMPHNLLIAFGAK
ncbi:TAF5-like RNA polymerase II p300/CBP-associated factor-associated factor 65 kDa subunit 5L [Dinothrombium tinctorium]|uniref:TAF5-like RNA polymerase II p300/CBP-associated factor-associated factor 65 kDa subunit 5L n=1 Tax=Dinothrombium tinctorium TaxID=1965070 RepID=A0A443R6Z6_9ACAR|nr:TAF5-like RNA polymerase II p300/CBP-associated factor-associated factor 65 kDa subunit 5L [Dinothrombium tinctorium]